ncbi:hypothetical protein ACRRTK_011645 [Alexandromys fortis]
MPLMALKSQGLDVHSTDDKKKKAGTRYAGTVLLRTSRWKDAHGVQSTLLTLRASRGTEFSRHSAETLPREQAALSPIEKSGKRTTRTRQPGVARRGKIRGGGRGVAAPAGLREARPVCSSGGARSRNKCRSRCVWLLLEIQGTIDSEPLCLGPGILNLLKYRDVVMCPVTRPGCPGIAIAPGTQVFKMPHGLLVNHTGRYSPRTIMLRVIKEGDADTAPMDTFSYSGSCGLWPQNFQP